MDNNKAEGFDSIFPLIGGHNLYQWLLFGIFFVQDSLFQYNVISYIFLAAVPEHWCDVDELRYNTNWTSDQIKNISIPRIPQVKLKNLIKRPGVYSVIYGLYSTFTVNLFLNIPRDGDGTSFHKCERYDLNYKQLTNKTYDEAYGSIDFESVEKMRCTKWTYDRSVYESTTVTEFDLVCDRAYLVAPIQATYMAAACIGSFIIGGLSDGPLGRRGAVLIGIGFVLIGGYGTALSSTYTLFIIFRSFIAVGVAATYQNCFTIMMEYLDISYRATIGMLAAIPNAIGQLVLPLYAYFIRDWSTLQLALTTSGLICLSYFWILPESSRWLISKGREEESFKILNRIAKINRKPKLEREAAQEIFEACKNEFDDLKGTTGTENTPKLPYWKIILLGLKNVLWNYIRLLETPELRKRSILLWILYMSVAFLYYGITFDLVSLSSDPYFVFLLGGFMEIPGAIGVIPFVTKWGRTPTVATTFLLTGVSMIGIAFVPVDTFALRFILSMSGKLFISAAFGVICMLGAELYPTQTRASGVACASIMGRVGSILAPFVVHGMKNVYVDLTSIIFGVTGIFAGLITLFLPETKDSELLESVNSIEDIHRVKTQIPNPQPQISEESL